MPTSASWPETIEQAMIHLSEVDPVLANAIARVGPCTLVPNPNTFETLVDAIVSQQISVKAADAIMARLRTAIGIEPGASITPELLAAFDADALRAVGLSTPKARYVRDLTERVTQGMLKLEELPALDDEEVISRLVAVKGIGRWTAEMILMFSLARLDVLPLDDLGFVEGVRAAYSLEVRPDRQALLERGEGWRPYRSVATWYIWALRRLSQNNQRERTRIVSL
ncbi:MAG TPA: DNA-3-methyladenine glycosylase [Ktedonobacteraceae bacterium]|nr:DNA-3-methyladenine glycosylase [Ktedonobacteraceae bacterium]